MICSRGKKKSFTYNGQPIETITDFKYLGIEIPSAYKWSKCINRRLAAAKKMYMFETICSHKDINSRKVRCILFEAYVMQTTLYGIEMWGGSISNKVWEDIKRLQKNFICRYLGVRVTTPYSMLLMESRCLPIEYYGLIRTLRYIQKIKMMHSDRIPRHAWDMCQKPKKNHKSKFLTSGWMHNIKRWFAKWNMKK